MSEIVITPASVIPSPNAIIKTGIAGATLSRLAPIIYQAADDTWKPADADGAPPSYKGLGWVLCDQDTGGPIHYCTYDPNFTPGFTLAIHDIAILSWTTAGKIRLIADLSGAPGGTWLTAMLFGQSTTEALLDFVNVNAAKP